MQAEETSRDINVYKMIICITATIMIVLNICNIRDITAFNNIVVIAVSVIGCVLFSTMIVTYIVRLIKKILTIHLRRVSYLAPFVIER